jgi:S-DNA-T family DNA segregation ATPase FtsK/SpoIIIE
MARKITEPLENERVEKRNKKTQEPKLLPTWLREVIGVGIVVLALFLFLGLLNPELTGILGTAVRVTLRTVFGQAAFAVVAMLGIVGGLLMLRAWRFSYAMLLVGLSGMWWAVVLEFFHYTVPRPLHWPLALKGGGWIGAVVQAVLLRAIGSAGMWIVLIGAGVILTLALSEMSLVAWFRRVGASLSARGGLLGAIWHWLFYRPTQDVEDAEMTVPVVPKSERRRVVVAEQTKPVEPKVVEAVPVPTMASEPVSDSPLPVIPIPTMLIVDQTEYAFPPLDLLDVAKAQIKNKDDQKKRDAMSKVLEETLASFNVAAKVVHVTSGPAVTRFELEPGVGVKIIKITALAKDIALKLAVPDVRIEAPIPGKALVGIEVPNMVTEMVGMRTIIEKTDFYRATSKLVCTLGLTITGDAVLMDLGKMPHVLIAGATGSGKSVCVNALILSILMRATPQEVKFLMIDPKKVELSLYEGIPHLVAPVVTDPHKAAATLNKWALVEMERRYETFSKIGVKNIEGYNTRIKSLSEKEIEDGDPIAFLQPLPYIVVIIDELADLMMVASQEVESTICRLAQMARATGIHLVVATQRPSVDVITGLIKANVPSRVSFFLQSQIDSRTILDMPGAEKLLGKGDMLYSPVGAFKPQRVQGVYVSEQEVKKVVSFLKAQSAPDYLSEVMDVEPLEPSESGRDDAEDPLFEEAKQLIMSTHQPSTSYLQRKLRIGYNRASRLMDELESKGLVDRRQQGRSRDE